MNGREGKGREGKGKEGLGMEGKGRGGKGREENYRRNKEGGSIKISTPKLPRKRLPGNMHQIRIVRIV